MSEAVRHDLNLLWVLAALGQTRHVERAAQLLGMTQPGVSNALKRLRAHFGDPLFVRTGRGMEPTPRGLQLVQSAQDILKDYEQRMLGPASFDPATTDTEHKVPFASFTNGPAGALRSAAPAFKAVGSHAPMKISQPPSRDPSGRGR